MFPKPTDEEKEQVVEAVKSFSTPLVPTTSLYRALEENEEMGHESVTWTLAELEIEDRVWILCIPTENDHGLPGGEYCYIPHSNMDKPLSH